MNQRTALYFATLTLAGVVLFVAILFSNQLTPLGLGAVAAAVLAVVISAGFYFGSATGSSIARQHDVAVIGFPKSGKTTLIISTFGEVFARRIGLIRVTPRGAQVIDRVTDQLEQLRLGRALGPTRDQDRFSYRADVTVRGFPLGKTYRVEFGDFPGEDSEKYIHDYGERLHNTEFFKWAVDADALVFTVDLANYLSDALGERKDFVASMSGSVQAAWQHYIDSNQDRERQARRHPVVLAFTKADLFGVRSDEEEQVSSKGSILARIAELGFGDEVPPVEEIDHGALERGRLEVERDFGDLIRYLESEASYFRVLFVSSFGTIEGRLLGIEKLLVGRTTPLAVQLA